MSGAFLSGARSLSLVSGASLSLVSGVGAGWPTLRQGVRTIEGGNIEVLVTDARNFPFVAAGEDVFPSSSETGGNTRRREGDAPEDFDNVGGHVSSLYRALVVKTVIGFVLKAVIGQGWNLLVAV